MLFLLSFVPMVLIVVIGFLTARSDSYRVAEQRIASLTEIARLSQQQLIDDVRQTLFVLAHAPAVALGGEDVCSGTLRDVMLASIIYTNLGAADPEGNVICNALPMNGPVNIADRTYFRMATDRLDFGVGDFQIGRITGKPAVNFAYPALNYRHTRVMRVIYSAVDVGWFGTRLRGNAFPSEVSAWVLDHDGDVLAALPGDGWVGRSVRGSALGDTILGAGPEPVLVEIDDLDGVRRLYGIAPVWSAGSDVRLRVAVGLSVADVLVAANRDFMINVGLLLAGTLLLVLLTFRLLRRKVLAPIGSLVHAADRLAADDFTVRAPDHTGIGEFSALGVAFNNMADAIGLREAEVARHLVRVEHMSRRYEVLSAINQTIVHADDETTMYRAAVSAIVDHGAGSAAWISRIDEAGTETLLASAVANGDEQPTDLEIRSFGAEERRRALLAGTRVVASLDDVAMVGLVQGDIAALRDAGHYIGYPIERSGKVFAVLNIAAGGDAVWLDEAGLALVREIAGDIGFALGNLDKDREIRNLAYNDTLTGLPNRVEMLRRCNAFIEKASMTGANVPLIKVKLLSLEQRIKRFGHSAGDFVIKSMATALCEAAPEDAVVGRSGEYTFIVLLQPDLASHTLAARIEAIFEGLPVCYSFGTQEIVADFNVGVASFPEDGESALALMQAAVLALDSIALGRVGAIAFHSVRLSVEARERWQIEHQLGHAIERDEFFVHYQPTKDLVSNRMIGVEALLRWRNSELGLVSPGRFIPIAEQAGHINEIGRWVFAETCRQMQAWVDAGTAPEHASVNVSVLQLYDSSFVDRIAALFEQFPAARGRIAVEITETAMMEDFEQSERVLGELQALGIAIFIDDFGTGYSSLSYLRRLPVDTLKIDLVFTAELGSSDEALSVIKAILALGQSLGLSTLAEGIETAEQEQILADIGCDVGQGYLFGRPLPPDEAAALFRVEG
jgi:diguanylate cyclase